VLRKSLILILLVLALPALCASKVKSLLKQKYLVIKNTRYKLFYKAKIIDNKEILLGECYQDEKIINISLDQSKEERRSTLLHEVIHAIDQEYQDKSVPPLTENQVLKMEKGLFEFLKKNKF